MAYNSDSFSDFEDALIDFCENWEVKGVKWETYNPKFFSDGEWLDLDQFTNSFQRDFYDIFDGLNR